MQFISIKLILLNILMFDECTLSTNIYNFCPLSIIIDFSIK